MKTPDTENNSKTEEITSSEQPSIDESLCSFKRGVCQIHLTKGKKTEISTKKWGKLKTGLQGWIYGRKVRWICQADSRTPVVLKSDSSVGNIPDGIAAPNSSNHGIRELSVGISVNTGVRVRVQDNCESHQKD